jgi:hypothetical protein
MMTLIVPLLIVGSVAAFLGGLGIENAWLAVIGSYPSFPFQYLISAALHAAWIIPAARRTAAGLVLTGWLASLHFCHAGLALTGSGGQAFAYSLLAESITLLLALALSPTTSWGERLARWRRARAEISMQLRMGEGLVSWLMPSVQQLLIGTAAMPSGCDYRRFSAELADAEHRLKTRLRGIILPEQVRQSILACANDLVGRAEANAARTGFELERMALAAAASCREQIEGMSSITAEQRKALADQCESLFFELIAPARQVFQPAAKANLKEA